MTFGDFAHSGSRSLKGGRRTFPRGSGEWLPRLEPGAAGQLAGGECESMTFARERRTPASWSTPASRPFASEIRLSDADLRVLCCAAARPSRRPGVDSDGVGSAGAHRPGGPSGCMVDSAGTVRPLRAPTPLIAWGLQCSVQRPHRTFARSMPRSRRACVRPCSGALSHRVSKHPERSVCHARHAVSGESAASRTP